MLTTSQRVEISKKLVSIPEENKAIDQTIELIGQETTSAQSLDDGNKSFFDQKNNLVNAYQPEIAFLNGTGRTSLTETLLQAAANMQPGNVLFPNLPDSLPPSLSQVWVFMNPFLLGYGVGKQGNETYIYTNNENDLTTSISSLISTIETFSGIIRATGQSCSPNPTPPPADIIGPDSAIQTASSSLLSDIATLQTVLANMQSAIFLADTDATRAAANQIAYDNITALMTDIQTWLSYPTFTAYPGVDSCAAFNSYNINLLPDTKYKTSVLQILKDALLARAPQLTSRISQVSGWLGGVSQNVSSGSPSNLTGFYGDRAKFLIQRMHRLNGSLQKLIALQNGVGINEEFKSSNLVAQDTYNTVMFATKFISAGNGTTKVFVAQPSFSIGQTVYFCSNTQPEVEAIVRSVSGNQIELSKPVPPTYRENEGARIYRIL